MLPTESVTVRVNVAPHDAAASLEPVYDDVTEAEAVDSPEMLQSHPNPPTVGVSDHVYEYGATPPLTVEVAALNSKEESVDPTDAPVELNGHDTDRSNPVGVVSYCTDVIQSRSIEFKQPLPDVIVANAVTEHVPTTPAPSADAPTARVSELPVDDPI